MQMLTKFESKSNRVKGQFFALLFFATLNEILINQTLMGADT